MVSADDPPTNPNNNLVTQAEFARVIGVSRQHVSQLKKAGRLVMDGGEVLVSQSRARIKATADPNRDDVRQRHAEERAATPKPPPTPSEAAITSSYQQSRAVKALYDAKAARLEYETKAKTLVLADDVRRAFEAQWTQLRIAMDHMRDQVSSELAMESDANTIHAILGDHHDMMQQEFCRGLQSMVGDSKGKTSLGE